MSSNGSGPYLNDQHKRELLELSSIDPAVVTERDYETIGRPSAGDGRPRDRIRRLGIPTRALDEDRYFSGLLIPMYGPTGQRVSVQWKPITQYAGRDGKAQRYASPKGQTNRLDVHPRNASKLTDPKVPLWITEGVKKADSLTSRGQCAIAITGVFNWRSNLGALGDWEDVPLKGRTVVICFDADARDKPNVLRAMQRLGRWLKSKGVKTVLYLIVPREVDGKTVKGVDDYFAAGGTLDARCAQPRRRPHRTATPRTTRSRTLGWPRRSPKMCSATGSAGSAVSAGWNGPVSGGSRPTTCPSARPSVNGRWTASPRCSVGCGAAPTARVGTRTSLTAGGRC